MRRSTVWVLGGLMLASAAHASSAQRHDRAHAGHHAHAAPHGGLIKTVGRRHLELTFDERNGTITLYSLGRRETTAHPIPAEPLTLRVESADLDAFTGPFDVVLLPIPQEDDPPGLASRFVGGASGLLGLERFRATIRTARESASSQTTFAVNASAFRDVFVCPMRCERGRTHTRAGRCSACGMQLKRIQDAHGDHSPKHGGILFMAPDGWHHLEGVLAAREFRLYLYNDFTQPIPATPFADGSEIEIVPLDERRRPVGEPVRLELEPASEGEYLSAPIPGDLSAPLDIDVRLKFQGRAEPDGFSFRFEDTAE